MSDGPHYGATWDGTNPLTGQPYRFDEGWYFDEPLLTVPNTGKNMLFHVSLGFAQMNDAPLDDFASNVAAKMLANATIFTSPPVTPANLTTAQVAFHNALAAAEQGGKQLTADKNARRATLIALLRQNANYAQGIPNITPANAMLSGFDIVMTGSHARVTLATPVILALTNLGSGQLGVKLQGSPGARSYKFQVTVGSGAPVHAGESSSTRNIVLPGLIPGTVYAVQACAEGGNNQLSAWSDPVSHMCT